LIGGLMYGFFTPTEAGSIGAFAVLALCLAKRDIHFTGYIRSVREALRTSCMASPTLASVMRPRPESERNTELNLSVSASNTCYASKTTGIQLPARDI